ncbi:hypothetical protein [Staphylococcus kloosii]|uniref:hypothetical protein n=1 Tax=Staphylococcus kloosii TaxID=29384 RepID=UPI0028A3516A|nr:hypothetical protein [Staphylococcus kloosii]MDT3959520.1 hypothetical protein [Staphylococcus kloosii]
MDIDFICKSINEHLHSSENDDKIYLITKYGKSYKLTYSWHSKKHYDEFISIQFMDDNNSEKMADIVIDQIAAIEYH